MRDLYDQANKRRNGQIDSIWDTLKFSTTLISGFNTATILLLGNTDSWLVGVIPIFGVIIGCFSLVIIRRQYNRFLEIITWINKIDKAAGFHVEVSPWKRFYKDEKHLLPEKWLKPYDTGQDFIDENLKMWKIWNGNMY